MKGKNAHINRIVFIVADTLRADKVGFHDGTSITPHIDRLGKDGIIFNNAYTTTTSTDPSITSMMTGKYPISVGLVNHAGKISKEEQGNIKTRKLLPEILAGKGFKTMAVDWLGRWHKRGYGYYSGRISNRNSSSQISDNLPLFSFLRYFGRLSVYVYNKEFILRLYYALFKKPYIPYDPADVVIDKAISDLKKSKENKLFLYLHLWDCHFPHTKSKGIRSYLFDSIEKTYEDEVKFMDKQIGRLYDFLTKSKMVDDTLVVFTSDHGENFSGPGRPLAHEGLTDSVVRIPLIIKAANFYNIKIDSLVQHLDIFPTILDFVNIPEPKGIDGNSLLPLMLGKKRQIRNFAYFEDLAFSRIEIKDRMIRRKGILSNNFKYILTLKDKKESLGKVTSSDDSHVDSEQLYNLKNDPKEKINLINKKKDTAKELSSKLENLIQELNIRRLDPSLRRKVESSILAIRKASKKYPPSKIAIAWTGGKDSTVLLSLVRLAYGEKIPFKVIFNDSTMEFGEIYKFVDKIKKLWNLDLITIKHSKKELKEFYATKDRERQKELSRLMKITAINTAVKKYKFKALIAGIRWDEHESRSKETYFSKRKDHDRIHPILHFSEKDVWDYINFFGVPYVNLYKKGYRSLGEKPFTKKATAGGGERSGREKEKEQLMANLRKLGYW